MVVRDETRLPKCSAKCQICCGFTVVAVAVPFRKLGDISVSVLGDCLSVAVIQQRPKDVLDKMDELQWV